MAAGEAGEHGISGVGRGGLADRTREPRVNARRRGSPARRGPCGWPAYPDFIAAQLGDGGFRHKRATMPRPSTMRLSLAVAAALLCVPALPIGRPGARLPPARPRRPRRRTRSRPLPAPSASRPRPPAAGPPGPGRRHGERPRTPPQRRVRSGAEPAGRGALHAAAGAVPDAAGPDGRPRGAGDRGAEGRHREGSRRCSAPSAAPPIRCCRTRSSAARSAPP